MRVVLVTGGARSGKSRWAAERARALGGDAVSFVATGRATDEEMARRIERHRATRPSAWETLEAAEDPAGAVEAARHDVVLLDCLTFVVAGAAVAEHRPGAGAPGDLASQAAGEGGRPERACGRPERDGRAEDGRAADEGEQDLLERARRRVEGILDAAEARRGHLLVVTNEVGMGVVPATPLGRWFRDAQGWANQRVAGVADEVVLLVSGQPVWAKGRGSG